MKPVIFDSEAEAEFKASAAYYESQRAGLGDEFAVEVEAGLQRIAQMPQALPRHGSSQLRKCILKRFPFTIFFLELEDRIWIAAVAHQRRRPNYWAHRQP
jgi:plasmid stabilization system protein ParE